MFNSTNKWIPIEYIKNGVIKTKEQHFCKVIEVTPINFKLKSKLEQEAILYQYKNFLRTCNFDMQILVKSKRNDIEKFTKYILGFCNDEKSEKVKKLMKDYVSNIKKEFAIKNSIKRRFYIVIKYDATSKRDINIEKVQNELNEMTSKIKATLLKCGNAIKEYNDRELLELFYEEFNKYTSEVQKI